jgi:hypothetical protein
MPFMLFGNQAINTDHIAVMRPVKNAHVSAHWQLVNSRGETLVSIYENIDKKAFDAVTEWVKSLPDINLEQSKQVPLTRFGNEVFDSNLIVSASRKVVDSCAHWTINLSDGRTMEFNSRDHGDTFKAIRLWMDALPGPLKNGK